MGLKKTNPVIITKTGVNELRVPANALSVFSSAIQNKKAGIRQPMLPDKKTSNIFFTGTSFRYFTATGNKITPDENTLKAATW